MGDKNQANDASASELQEQMQKHALAYAEGTQYAKNPTLLDLHQSLRFDPLPPDSSTSDNPAQEVVGFLVTHDPNHVSPQAGHYYVPTNAKVNSQREITRANGGGVRALTYGPRGPGSNPGSDIVISADNDSDSTEHGQYQRHQISSTILPR